MEYFVPIGPGSGASTFALIRKEGTMYAFGNDGGFQYMHMIDKVNVTDSIRSNPNPSLSSSSPLSTGAIIGIVVGAIIVLVGIVFIFFRRYQIRRNKDDNSAIDIVEEETTISAEEDHISICSKKIGDNDGPNYLYLEGKFAQSNSNLDWQTGSTDMLPMAPITPVPERLLDQLEILQEKMRAVQGRIQVTQLSTHLPSDVVTTVSCEDELAMSDVTDLHVEGSATMPREPCEPTIFGPPAGSAQIADLHNPSAPTYISVMPQS
ncbi:hypothetical protein BGZ96_001518 [Linnemannia gamsii]|uniref:Uncharacterized protein n=1 Tax=Linnemannia gamsii TaxID=64522 RepID=A0ABQ7JM48_9FUNG|nr:hypothetical protein BGZ96_001518 [Linnemannia gamsii]